jgi:hypothetical protein
VRGGDPASVRVEEEEENHAESHEVHIDQEQDAAVVEAPARLHATNRVNCAEDGGQGGDDEERSGAIVGEVGEDESCGEAGQDKDTAAWEGSLARIEKAGEHAILSN